MNIMSGVLYLQSSEQVQANCSLKSEQLLFLPDTSAFSLGKLLCRALKNKMCMEALPLGTCCGLEGIKGLFLPKTRAEHPCPRWD